MPADLAETSCPVIYFEILREDDFDENRRTGKDFKRTDFENVAGTVIRGFIFVVRRTGGNENFRAQVHRENSIL